MRFVPGESMTVAEWRERLAHKPTGFCTAVDKREAKLSRCGVCGQWTWDGVCTLHPDAGTSY